MSKDTATVVKKLYANGRIEDVNEEMTLRQMQKFVGGYIEKVKSVTIDHGLIVNEDGVNLELPKNEHATALVAEGVMMWDGVRGNALLVTN